MRGVDGEEFSGEGEVGELAAGAQNVAYGNVDFLAHRGYVRGFVVGRGRERRDEVGGRGVGADPEASYMPCDGSIASDEVGERMNRVGRSQRDA